MEKQSQRCPQASRQHWKLVTWATAGNAMKSQAVTHLDHPGLSLLNLTIKMEVVNPTWRCWWNQKHPTWFYFPLFIPPGIPIQKFLSAKNGQKVFFFNFFLNRSFGWCRCSKSEDNEAPRLLRRMPGRQRCERLGLINCKLVNTDCFTVSSMYSYKCYETCIYFSHICHYFSNNNTQIITY